MNKTYKRIWLRALRGNSKLGVYKQTEGLLYDDEDGGFCCLGVITNEVVGFEGRKGGVSKSESRVGTSSIVCEYLELPVWLLIKLKLSPESENHLMEMNDSGKGFEEIADWIEENE